MSKVAIVTGANGQVGHALGAMVWPEGWTVRAFDRTQLDITDAGSIEHALADGADVVINCGAYTAVDKAQSEVAAAYRANAEGPRLLAAACAARSIPLVHVSTDYVFDGTGAKPWEVDDPIAPINVYGASKAAGEFAVRGLARYAIVRTSWVVSATGHNFVKTMIALAGRDALNVVDDQIGAPTAADDLAAALQTIAIGLADRGTPSGIYHFANAGEASWHGVAAAIFARMAERGQKVPTLNAIPTTDYPTPAARPHNSRLSLAAIGRDYGIVPRDWHGAIEGLVDTILGDRPD